MNNKYIYFIALLAAILITACGENSNPDNSVKKPVVINPADTMKALHDYPEIKYELVTLKGAKHWNEIMNKYADSLMKKSFLKAIMVLNRKELRFIRPDSKIVIPDKSYPDMTAYSLFPELYPGAVKIPKIVMVSNKWQCYGCYEYGKLVRFAPVNSGKERTPTYPGRYAMNWKQLTRVSSLDSSWILPFTINFHQEAGNAFHQFEMPGRPVSHSCMRQLESDAQWLYKWGRGRKLDSNKKSIPMSGTPVIILDVFDFSRKSGGPWQELKSNKDSTIKLPPDPMAVEEARIPIIQIPEASRGCLRDKQRYVTAEDTLRARGLIRPGVTLTPSVDFNKERRIKQAKKAKKEAADKEKAAVEKKTE